MYKIYLLDIENYAEFTNLHLNLQQVWLVNCSQELFQSGHNALCSLSIVFDLTPQFKFIVRSAIMTVHVPVLIL